MSGTNLKVIVISRLEYVFKVIFIGDGATGKTSLIAKHAHSSFKENYIPTVCANVSAMSYQIDETSAKLAVWDIAGQEGFKNVRTQYYDGAAAVFVVYDVTRSKTFQDVRVWLEDVLKFVSKPFLITLIGNKIDLAREVKKEDGEKLAKEIGAEYLETSAKTGENVEAVFSAIAQRLVAEAHSRSSLRELKK